MSSERHQRVKAIFNAAVELEPGERADFLSRACGGDADLHDEVDALLATDAEQPGFLEPVAADTLAAPVDPLFPSSEGEFVPGHVLNGRYRIVALLGEGGMGSVYLADDLTLDQQVAIKFLPLDLALDAESLERFRGEVRVARRVSHSNVARTHDIGEVSGRHFLTMEFVDGEDLSRLLKRIGRLPREKASDIAQQLCHGLAAAHGEGVLHRDLKPANVMLDGEGRVKITDFGLAVVAGEAVDEGSLAGTPSYMAPEQLAGEPATQQSEVYALGLVLYELFTGQRAFEGRSIGELARQHAEETPRAPSSLLTDIDPAVESVILRCLEKDTARRYPSVRAVALALPGGDPLAAAVEAGETPAPELVAEAGARGGLALPAAMGWLVLTLAALVSTAAIAGSTRIIGLFSFDRAPAVLEARARDVLAIVGRAEGPAHHLQRFVGDWEAFIQVGEQDDSPDRWQRLATARPPVVRYLYRESPTSLGRMISNSGGAGGTGVLWSDRRLDPPHDVPGMARIELDTAGRLIEVSVVPSLSAPASPAPEFDWSRLFAESALDPKAFEPIAPAGHPGVETDARLAWEGADTGDDRPLRVEAGAFHGLPVYWSVQGPPQSTTADLGSSSPGLVIGNLAFYVALLVGAGALAHRNLRRKRADRRGAFRLAVTLLAAVLAAWFLGEEHVLGAGELHMFQAALEQACFTGLIAWILYLAIEPSVRRLWPHRMTSWIRLLEGRLGDPLVRRDLLVGAALGAGLTLLRDLSSPLARWAGQAPPMPPLGWLLALLGGRYQLAQFVALVPASVTNAFFMCTTLVVLRFVLRRQALVVPAFLALSLFMSGELLGPLSETLIFLAVYGLVLTAFLRYGLLTFVAAFLVGKLLIHAPLTLDSSAWYAQSSALALALCASLAVYGFWGSLAGRPILDTLDPD